MKMKKLPIGIQNTRDILEKDRIYVDKTPFILRLLENGKHYFMSRPRRFGKSLFISTLAEVFKGNRELFQGLKIYDSHYDWQEHCVLQFNFSLIASREKGEFITSFQETIDTIAQEHYYSLSGSSIQIRLASLIKRLS